MGNGASDGLVERQTLGHVLVLTVRVKEVVAAEVIEPLAQALRRALRESQATDVILDLSGVQFLTSGALGMLIHLQSQLQDQDRDMMLAGATGDAARVLAHGRLSEIMPIYESVEAAVRDVRCPPKGGPKPGGPSA